jgi:AmmeMemoRadiSam system protein B
MKKNTLFLIFLLVLTFFINACKNPMSTMKERTHLVDTVGFAQYPWQIDSLLNRIDQYQGDVLKKRTETLGTDPAKAVVSPHDDYTYVGYLYPATLSQVKAKTVILFGVAHKAAKLHLENQLIFDSFDTWKGPYGKIKVSPLREKIMKLLPKEDFQVNDSMQSIEHSVEAELPWLQHYNRQVEIVSILVPAMPFERMEKIAKDLSAAIEKVAQSENLSWGKDFAFVISTDAVHYGDEGWGGKNFAFYGTACTSYKDAKGHEMEILHDIAGYLSPGKIHDFCRMTVEENDFRKYKWTWCGRYSVPLGLLTVNDLNESLYKAPIKGQVIGYSASIEHEPIPVSDLKMGVTAPANDHHWVGYAALKYN